MLKIALTHDIDKITKTYQFITKPLKCILQAKWDDLGRTLMTLNKDDNYWNFDQIIEIERNYNVRSTFFFLNESIRYNLLDPKTFYLAYGRYSINEKRIVDIIHWLDENGWEIGVHGSYNSYMDFELMLKEKKILENIVGHDIIGIRQHHLNLNQNTWIFQEKAGFKYDSSFGSNDVNGYRDNFYKPFKPLENNFLVFPQVIMDSCLMKSKSYQKELDMIFELSIMEDSILVVNFHNDKFNPNDFPGYREAYIYIIEKALKYGAEFKTLGEYYLDFSSIKNYRNDFILP